MYMLSFFTRNIKTFKCNDVQISYGDRMIVERRGDRWIIKRLKNIYGRESDVLYAIEYLEKDTEAVKIVFDNNKIVLLTEGSAILRSDRYKRIDYVKVADMKIAEIYV